ncbi:MAG: UMP kinase, partial [bacterium]
MNSNYSETIVLKLGGSLIVPNGGLDILYITEFYNFIRKQVKEHNRRFFIFPGGGKLSRHYIDAGAKITGQKLTGEDLDWLAIHVTRLNAHLFRTIFRDLAHPRIIDNYDFIEKTSYPVIIASGWKPGWSTDYNSVVLANDYRIKTIIKMSNIDYIYNKDPKKFSDAKKIEKMKWSELQKLVGTKWIPGKSTPFDPIATKLASDSELKVLFLHGKDLENVD